MKKSEKKYTGRGGWRGGGRPKKDDSEKRIAVQLSLAAVDRDRLDEAAGASEMTRSAFVIMLMDRFQNRNSD